MEKALVILGPTASGKTAVGLEAALLFGGEIVSVDSRQAYRHLDVGTAKPTPEQRRLVPHHLIDILDLHERNNAERFARLARESVDRIAGRGRIPILVGGSGLYLRAFLNGFFRVELDPDERTAFAKQIEGVPTDELHRRLRIADPRSAARIHSNDRYRIVRALEVSELTGTPMSEHFDRQHADDDAGRSPVLKIGLALPRTDLNKRIDERTGRMMSGGWLEEVDALLAGGARCEWPGMKTLGYPEVIALLQGRLSRREAESIIAMQTRRYAKRQITWFRKEPGVTWIDVAGRTTGSMLEEIGGLLEGIR